MQISLFFTFHAEHLKFFCLPSLLGYHPHYINTATDSNFQNHIQNPLASFSVRKKKKKKMFKSSTRIPIKSPTDPGPIKRHHTAGYYAHRVRDSLTTQVSKIVCTIFLGLLFIIGLITFILWLSLRPHRPRFHIHEFSVPGLSQDTGFANAQISFNASARNSNHDIGIYYDAMDGAVYYRDQQIGSLPGLLYPFYQDPKNTTLVEGVFSGATLTVSSERWMEFQNDRAHGTVVFRLEMTSRIRFKISTWTSKGHRMHANCEVSVGSDGSILPASKDKRCPVYFA
ncbi:NDR1/HIN1-like protein 26 [Ziziphus jujuba]|uniref:NDR1/HIN1-like protein 26 n=1 Tax=Ziziphus jujuba TaxID=326968 RepID=A0A6P4AF47_ZIZJJ|nr:NDR1/HIN1-like protein 26 [Ziziphus jujuba]